MIELRDLGQLLKARVGAPKLSKSIPNPKKRAKSPGLSIFHRVETCRLSGENVSRGTPTHDNGGSHPGRPEHLAESKR